jgi:gamma-glutamyl phosphate reductase
MLAAQQKKGTARAARVSEKARRKNYLAAVRYLDGRREIIEVRNADDLADARLMVLEELGPVRCLLLSERR